MGARRPLLYLPAFALALSALAGCVQRTLRIRTDPPGARVFVNGVDRGQSPVVVPYVHPGRIEIRLEKEGFESLATEFTTPSTVDTYPVVDFFAEAVQGRRLKETVADYRLVPLKTESYTQEELREILRKAEAFRARAENEAKEPSPPLGETPTPPRDR